MMQPVVMSVTERPFAAFAVAVQAIIVNDHEQILLLSSARRGRAGVWQTVSGGLEASETVLTGTLREVAEEVGPDVRVRPLGLVHAQSFHYDSKLQHMIGVYYLLAYEGGNIVPGDDMIGSEWRWWSLVDLETVSLHASTHLWMLRRAVQLYRLWRDEGERPLQPFLGNQ
ncbi:MAG: NUDIX hydrolase [Anaerolinea sp.]|nr:NUDIX hydrolase [Anaerolinea sp.]